jgi:hypothetical protein
MKAVITRSGGFAGITRRHHVELSREELEELRSAARTSSVPDGFTYEITTDGESFTVTDTAVIEKLLR